MAQRHIGGALNVKIARYTCCPTKSISLSFCVKWLSENTQHRNTKIGEILYKTVHQNTQAKNFPRF